VTEVTGTASMGQAKSESPSANPRSPEPGSSAPRGSTDKASPSSSGRSSTAELGGMLLAFLLGGVGFAVRIFWIPALVVMAVVFGLILADRRAAKGSKGVVPEIVANVMHEAREIYQAASGTSEEEEGDGAAAEKPDESEKEAGDEGDMPARDAATHSDAAALPEGSSPFPDDEPADDPTRTNGHSPNHVAATSLSDAPKTSERSAVHADADGDGDAADSEDASVGGRPAATHPVEISSVQSEPAENGGSIEREDAEPEDRDVDDDVPISANGSTDTSVSALSVRFIVSADQMAARNPLLRPVRRRALGIVTSLSKTIVQLAAAPPEDSQK
jgi:hypothetical protein